MTWVLLGPLAPFLREDLGLTATEQGLMTAIPLLGGSLFRPVLGMLGDRIGGRRTGIIGMVLTLVTLTAGWQFASTPLHLYGLGLMLGIAGASFAVALPLASRWYPPQYQGLAMGIAGAGNSGTLLATLFAPRLAERFGWAATFGLAIVPLLAVFLLFVLMARDSPRRVPPATLREYGTLLREPDALALAFLYSLTFGGFVGFASFLPTFFVEQYHLSRVSAGDVTTVVVVSGSLLRPVGGWLSDRFGGYRLLVTLLGGFALCLCLIATGVALPSAVALFFCGIGLLGMGNGAVFQLVPQRFPDRIGLVTGIVGAAGGLGGFFLPSVLGVIRDVGGSYAPGLALFALAFVGGTVVLLELGDRWSRRWSDAAVRRAGVYSYRATFRGAVAEEP
jgi:NNP family nitrate/nitrite transporter-like MFS transporter